MTPVLHSALTEVDLTNRKVFLRADLNVPCVGTTIIDTFRLEKLRPTLDLLIKKQSCICIGTHRGRPKGYEEQLSTKYLVGWFKEQGYSITWAPTLSDAHKEVSQLTPGTLLLLENLRFSPGEKDGIPAFAQELRQLGDYYVNDAWGALENEDTSITLLPELYSQEDKTIGLLVEQELQALNQLRPPKRPFIMIMGGAKIQEKLPAVDQALDLADTVILLPPLAFTFMKAQGISVGSSLVDDNLVPLAQKILAKASHSKGKLLMPTDFMVGSKDLSGPLSITSKIAEGQMGIALGPESLEHCIREIGTAASLFFNGPMGFFERPDTLEPLKKLLQAIVQSNTVSVVGGGESVAAVKLFGLEQHFTFCSTGGGTTLHYILSGTLPGLRYLS